MNWHDALSHIQSPTFDAELNVVSGTKSFFRALRSEPAVQESLKFMRDSGEIREEVLGRICDLAMLETDPRYENPNDTPLATLLWLTRYTDPHFALLGARYVELAPRCWYARKLARQITDPPPPASSDFRASIDPYLRVISNNSSTETSFSMISPVSKVRFVAAPTDEMTFRSRDSVQTQESGSESYLGSYM